MNFKSLTAGDKAPEEFLVVIEIPQNSRVKYEVDKDSGMIMADRINHAAFGYVLNYGTIPGTLAQDGDPVDVLVMCSETLVPGCGIKCRALGYLETEDEAGVDPKILAVPLVKVDPFYSHYNDISEVNPIQLEKIQHFYEHYKDLEKGKWVKVGKWMNSSEAKKTIKEAIV